ncbi:ATP-binding cassette domain-containing protein [bacterium]|nr:ATP-binding cassette domain-containing protein [bacterium]
MIQLKDVAVIRDKKTILGPLSFAVKEKDFVGIIGPNGAGKSTLLNLLLGLEPITRGSLQILGHEFSGSNKAFRMARKKIGVLFQDLNYQPDVPLLVEEVVYFGRGGLSVFDSADTIQDNEIVQQAMEKLGLCHLSKRLYRDLSGGEKQKVQLARLLAQKSSLVLLDEPTAGLDLDWQERLTQIVEEIFHSESKTIVMVTHEVDKLPACCNKLLMLKKGKLLLSGNPKEICRPEILSELYGCHMEVVVRGNRIHAFSQGTRVKPWMS